ncbi:unnamed protein product, partial [Rotaria sp. Silwood1]
MPVTTRAAALRSHTNADLIHSQDQATPTSTSTGKTTHKCSSKQKRKQAQVQQIISCAESQICPPLQSQSTTLDAVLTLEGIHEQPHEDVILKKDDATGEPTSSTPITGSVSPTTSSPTKNDDNDSIISLESSNKDENEIFAGDSKHLMNVPVIKGEVTTGTSTRESGLHKLRRKSLSPIPQNQKFLLPPAYQETYSHQKFLIYDKRKTIYGGRLMIFASDEQLNVLYGSDVLFADGTFKLPDTSITGCWFHMCQACYRNILEIALMKLYESDPELRHLLRTFMGLALVPIEHIPDGFQLLKKKLRASSEAAKLRAFLDYFEKQWFNNFKPEMLSVSDSH